MLFTKSSAEQLEDLEERRYLFKLIFLDFNLTFPNLEFELDETSRIVRADLLLRSATGDQKAEGRRELERARALMRETGAMLFERFINAADAGHGNTHRMSTKANREDRLA